MDDTPRSVSASSDNKGYADLQEHVAALEKAGLVYRITEPVNKDTEMHALVRWQYRGGIPEHDRKAFLFTNVTDSKGRKYDMPVIVGALAGSREIYRMGLNVPKEEIGAIWQKALDHPIPPVVVSKAPCQEVVIEGADLIGAGKGLDALPVPISTPGFDSAPYITAGNFVTKDPENGIQNLGTYRAGLKASNRLVVRMATRNGGAGGYPHWEKYRALGQKMPCACVLGCPPAVAYTGPQKVMRDVDELAVAGGLAGAPIRIVKCRTVDLMVPAEFRDHHRRPDRYDAVGARSAVRRIAWPYLARRFQHDLRDHLHHPSPQAAFCVHHQPGDAVGILVDQARCV